MILYTALLFAVWHVGYMVNALAEGNWVAVVSKVLVGFCYGLLLGWVRTKTGNCYASCLLHGLMNLLSDPLPSPDFKSFISGRGAFPGLGGSPHSVVAPIQ